MSTTRIMLNGDPGRTIFNCKGLRQGDPISPMLFILTMEPLHRLFEWAASRGFFAVVGAIVHEEEALILCG